MLPVLAALLGFLYCLGYRRRLHLVGRRWGSAEWRAVLFASGVLVVITTELPSVTTWASAFFWVRTSQVMALVMVAAPLLVLGSPEPVLRRLTPSVGRHASSWRGSRNPIVIAGIAFLLLNSALWIWHLPAVYQATLGPAAQVTDCAFLYLGYLFWTQVIDQPPRRARLNHLARAIYLVLASMQLRFLALLIGFAHAPFYSHYAALHGGGLALFDQQIGAGIMLVPGILSDLIALTACLFLWLADEDRRGEAKNPQPDPARAVLPIAAG